MHIGTQGNSYRFMNPVQPIHQKDPTLKNDSLTNRKWLFGTPVWKVLFIPFDVKIRL